MASIVKGFMIPALCLISALAASCSGSSGGPSSTSTSSAQQATATASINVDAGQQGCYGADGSVLSCPSAGNAFAGQDAQYASAQMRFQDNGDGAVSGLDTGLMWQKSPGAKVSFDTATANASSIGLTGHSDWRLPSIKELYSLMNFTGATGSSANDATPYIDTAYFDFTYGDTSPSIIKIGVVRI